MDCVIDLDAAAAVLASRLAERTDLESDPITWRGFESSFDEPFTTDRGAIIDPYSVGVRVRRGEEKGLLVLYAGGWADLEYWSGDVSDGVRNHVAGWQDPLDVPRFDDVVVELLALFTLT